MDTIEPSTPQQLAAELSRANQAGLALAPAGGRTKSEWGNPPSRCDAALSTAKLNRVIEHAWADLTVTVEAGCTLANLQAALAERGQRLAVDPLWPERATIGGILSTNDSGALRLRFGALRDLIIGVTVALPDGILAMSGGKVVKNVAGYDLPKLVTGALGTLGVITQAVFRLHPLPRSSKTFSITEPTAADAQDLLLSIQNSQLAHTSLQWRDGTLDVLFEGTDAGIAAQEATLRKIAPGISEASPEVWSAREQLWEGEGAIVKFSVLPSNIARALAMLGQPSAAVVQAIGLGYARISLGAKEIVALRTSIEKMGGSLTVLRQPSDGRVEAWGSAGDALPLMLALKQQFDPHGTLNPGRYVGGI